MIQFWGVEEVGNWLESLGLSEYKELFAKHDIRGPELLALDRPDLKVSLAVLQSTEQLFTFHGFCLAQGLARRIPRPLWT